MIFILPLQVASWFMGLMATYFANIVLYVTVLSLNVALAVSIYLFHFLGDRQVITD